MAKIKTTTTWAWANKAFTSAAATAILVTGGCGPEGSKTGGGSGSHPDERREANHLDLGPSQRSTTGVCDFDRSVLGDYNLVVFEDLTQPSSDTQGRVAVGGNATLAHYSIGDQLPNTSGNPHYLVVGGDLNFASGRVYYGRATVRGRKTVTNQYNPTFDGGIHRADYLPVDFQAMRSRALDASSRFANLRENGQSTLTLTGDRGVLSLRGNDPSLNVFHVDASEWSRAYSIDIDAPRGSRVIVNVAGGLNGSISVIGGRTTHTGAGRRDTIVNFFEATHLNIKETSFEGTLLAPNTHLNFETGIVQGQVIVRSLSGRVQMNAQPFLGCPWQPAPPKFPAPTKSPSPTQVPAPTKSWPSQS